MIHQPFVPFLAIQSNPVVVGCFSGHLVWLWPPLFRLSTGHTGNYFLIKYQREKKTLNECKNVGVPKQPSPNVNWAR